ncbi:MAG TPA: NAD(+) diphosphatase [Candidatus Nanopelagicales bacterium]|jgi:NAD+ diphosphatase
MPDRQLLAALTLARATYDRAALHRTDAGWLGAAWAGTTPAQVMVLHRDRALVSADGSRLVFAPPPTASEGVRILLGVEDDVAYLAVLVPDDAEPAGPEPEGARWATLREVGAKLGARDSGLLASGVALAHWHGAHPRCPLCGEPTVPINAGWARQCPVDDSEHFPRHDPAVIVLVRDDADRALLGRRADWDPSWYSTLAGFVEAGESAEMTLLREMYEEAGVRIDPDRLDYLGSQPWPFPSSLMLGYLATVAADSPEALADGDELSEVRWFTRAELAAACQAGTVRLPGEVSIARRLVEHWYGSALPGSWSRP